MNHIHIGTPFLFVIVLLILGVAGIVAWSRASKRRYELDKLQAERRPFCETVPGYKVPGYDGPRWYPKDHTPYNNASTAPPAPSSNYDRSWTSPPPTQIIHSDGGGGLLTGLVLGEMLAGGGRHDTTVVHESYNYQHADTGGASGFDAGGASSGGGDGGGFDASF